MNNLFSAIELGKNSIMAQQSVFSIIGHNIANVNTPGYSRQVVDLENVRPSVIGLKDGGRGVDLIGIRSIRDQFIDNQITDRRQYEGLYNTLDGVMASVEALFDESNGLGLSDGLTNFFNAWADVANQPTNIPTRNSLVSKTQSFTLAMNKSHQRLVDQQEVNDANVAATVQDINAILNEIAKLNEEVAYAEGSGNPANDLLDIRERRIRELSEMVGISHYYDASNNSVTIDLGGRPLVSFNNVNELSAIRNQYNSNYHDVYVDQYGQPAFNITTEIDTGKLGGLIVSRDGQVVDGPGTVSGTTAGGLTTLSFSQDHGLSVGDLVTINGETRSVVQIGSTTTAVVADMSTAVTAGNNYGWQERDGYIPEYKKELNKLATGLIQQVNDAHGSGYGLNDATAPQRDFFQMNSGVPVVSNVQTDIPAPGQQTITFGAAHSLSVGDVVTIRGQSRLVLSTNGNAIVVNTINGIAVNDSYGYSNVQAAAASIQVDSTIASDSSLIAASSQPTVDGTGAPLAVGNNDVAQTITQLMDANDVVDTNNNGRGNYGTFHEYLHSMYSEVGNTGSSATYELDANGSMLTYLENKRDSISGVSLDEEAANLMQFEKSFQAIAQFMGTVSKLTDVLIQLV